jgi:integrase
MAEHLIRRNGRYFYRRRVPADLIEAYGKKEFQKALGTADPKEAAKLKPYVDVEFNSLCDRERAKLLAPQPAMEIDPLADAAETWDPNRVIGPMTAEEKAAFDVAVKIEAVLDPQVAYMLAKDAEQARELVAQRKATDQMKDAIRAVLAEQRPLVALALPPEQPAPTSVPALSGKPATSLVELLHLWAKSRTPDPATIERMHMVVGRFHDAAGKYSVKAINRAHVLAYQSHVAGLGLKPSTVRTQVAHLRALLQAAVDAGMIPTNPADNVKTDVTRSAKTARMPFSKADITAIFASPVYTEGLRPKPAGGEAAYWLPLIALFTGARLEELGQLSPADVRTETYTAADGADHATPVIYLTDEGENQGLKNQASRRRVPLHPALIEQGFMRYVAKQKGDRLFPALVANKHGRETAAYSRWFGMYLRSKCGISDTRKTFHSYRHHFKDVMREAGVSEDVSDALSGHTNGSSSRDYGGSFYPLRPLVEAMNKYRISGVTLPGAQS